MTPALPAALRALARGLTLILGCTGVLAAQEAPKPGEKPAGNTSGPKVLETFEVTGSRVKRLDYETPSPVVTYSAAAIEDKSYLTLGEFLQSLTFNSATANSEFTTGSFVTGAATVNPRGLGSNRVLTLVDGRRSVPYALTNSSGGTPQTVFNFNSIPSSAIARVEFLKDGASAIYGSDAITGVYNIILKRNYVGSSVEMFVSNTLGHDSLSRRVAISSGFAAKGWHISFAANVQARNSNFLVDFDVPSTDYRYLGLKGSNFNSVNNHPSFLQLNAATATAAGLGTLGGFYVVPNPGTANPTKASFTYIGTASASIPNTSRYNLAPVTQIYPSSENYGGHVSVERVITPYLTAFGRAGYGRNDSHHVVSPYLFTSTLAGITIPVTNPYNPTGLAITNTATTAQWSFASASPKREVSSRTQSALGGLRGTVLQRWNWEAAVNYGQNETTRHTDLISAGDLQAALNGTTRATAYNPFGPSDDPTIGQKLFTRSRGLDGKVKSLSYDANVSGKLYQLPFEGAGEVGVAVGYEHRNDRLRSSPEPINYLGYTGVPAYKGKRNVDAAYVELSAPITKWLEFQVAARHEEYSDFGNTTKPKYSGKIRLPANRFLNVLARASYSESFKAPDLGQLYAPISRATTGATYFDPLRPQDAARQLNSRVGGNPNLKPEEGTVKYGGFVFEVPAVKGLSFNADYFDIQIVDQINSLTAGYLLSRDGREKFPNAIVRDNSTQNPGPIAYVDSVSNNLGLQLFRGWDFGLRYTLRSTRRGTFTFNADATHIMKRGSDNGQGGGFVDNTGLYFDVEWRYNYGLTWRYKNWGAAVTADVIGRFFNDRNGTATYDGWGENVYPIVHPSITYRGFKKTTITIGANNVFDNRPPPNGFIQLGFDDRAYANGVLGITLFMRARRDF